jgi:cysteinyl-tRNA synthetase
MNNPKIFLHNTLSGKKELFKPIKKSMVGMYHCGPTVYDDAHIGNLRAYVFADTLRRMFEYNDYEVKQIINITDVGHLSSRLNKPMTLEAMKDIGTLYFEHFIQNLKDLNIELPGSFPRASDNITEDLELIQKLEERNIAYRIGDGVYFDTSKFPEYGKLGKVSMKSKTKTEGRSEQEDPEKNNEGTRIKENPEKRNSADFALWKFDEKIGWESPWGRGFPGWHIECSAMARKYLGQPFDIHTGGTDHIPTHHNNEIAQSEAAFEQPLANYWLHSDHVVLNEAKIAKSAGNSITLDSLRKMGADTPLAPLSYRYWLLTAHYRSLVNFSIEAVLAAQNAYVRLVDAFIGWKSDNPGTIDGNYQEKFRAAINDDIDMPAALAITWQLVKDHHLSMADKRATLLDFDRVFGLGLEAVELLDKAPLSAESLPPDIFALSEARDEARATKEWQKADALRAEIESRGFTVTDAGEGSVIRKAN